MTVFHDSFRKFTILFDHQKSISNFSDIFHVSAVVPRTERNSRTTFVFARAVHSIHAQVLRDPRNPFVHSPQ
jgi:peroxiredoxin